MQDPGEQETWLYTSYVSWSRVHKAFQNKDQDQAQVKNSYIMAFF